ncbi:MAG: hypothetical protein HOE11_03845 [Candidatus Diapherotrites archaeon]|jgi:hypothetical protein|nr:hypothetical protein [Candidatus Diapherotrites archaeon]MBT4597231.1 hypothetical protein [Candidatus Diapherotrites archaeon]
MSFRTAIQKLRTRRTRAPKPPQVIREPKVSTVIGEYLGTFDRLYKKEWLAIQPALKKTERLLAKEELSPKQRLELAKSKKTVRAFYRRTSTQFESREIEVGDSIIELKFTPISGTLTITPRKIAGKWVRTGAYKIDMGSHKRAPQPVTK